MSNKVSVEEMERALIENLRSGKLKFSDIICEFEDPATDLKKLGKIIFEIFYEDSGFTKDFFMQLIEKNLTSNEELKKFLESVRKHVGFATYGDPYNEATLGDYFMSNSWLIPYCYDYDLFTVDEMLSLLTDVKKDLISDEEHLKKVFNFKQPTSNQLLKIINSIDTSDDLQVLCGAAHQHGYTSNPQGSYYLLEQILDKFLFLSIDLKTLNELSATTLSAYEHAFFDSKTWPNSPREKEYQITVEYVADATYLH